MAVAMCVVVAGWQATVIPAAAQDAPRWSVSFDLGMLAPVSGDVHSGGSGTVLDLPTTVDARSYNDVFGSSVTWAAGLGYRVGSTGEFRVTGGYTTDTAERIQVGNVAGLPLFGQFGDYSAFRMDAGYRQYFGSARVRPFAGASAGLVRLSDATAEFTVPAAGVTLSGVGFFDTSTVPTFGGQFGVEMGLTPNAALQIGAALNWHGAYTDVDGLAGTGLERINDETSRWSMPITAGLTLRF